MRRAEAYRSCRLDAVADVFLSPSAATSAGTAVSLLYAAAPGIADTASVLATLRPAGAAGSVRDLGPAVGVRLGRLERTGDIVRAGAIASQLVWCPCAEEGLALTAAMTLGRVGALTRPTRVMVLWFAGGVARIGRGPSAQQREYAKQLAGAAVPGAAVSLHCLGWRDDPLRQLASLADRFQ